MFHDAEKGVYTGLFAGLSPDVIVQTNGGCVISLGKDPSVATSGSA